MKTRLAGWICVRRELIVRAEFAKAIVGNQLLELLAGRKVELDTTKAKPALLAAGDYDAMFSLLDLDKSGAITVDELTALFRSLGTEVSDTKLAAMFAKFDQSITREEFVSMMCAQSNASH